MHLNLKHAKTFALACPFLIFGNAEAAALPAGAEYVAIGSSYAAGTNLSHQADDSPTGCAQGSDNYPRQVARALNLKLVDRSCGGATMRDLLQGGQFNLPAQLDAVSGSTQLVTITSGGNDVRFVADLAGFSCRHQNADVPEASRPNMCAPSPGFRDDEAFDLLELTMRELLTRIRNRAPKARIVVVDYLMVVPPTGTCAALAMSEQDAAIMRARAARLAALTAKLTAEAGADLVAASVLSKKHDVCSENPWVWGFVPNYEPSKSGAVPFHPRPTGIAAVAREIVTRLQK